MNIRQPVLLHGALIVFAPLLQAHHSQAAFDVTAPDITLTGTVTEVEWSNPHVYVYIETDGNESERWALEGDTPGTAVRLGWTREAIGPGDRVVVTATPPRDPEQRLGHLTTITKDGELIWDYSSFIGAMALPSSDATTQADSIAGVWEPLADIATLAQAPTFRLVLGTLPLTELGRTATENYLEEEMALLDCELPRPGFSMINGDLIAIEVEEDLVVIREANFATTRTVYLDEESHEGIAESHLGHAIGRWDGMDLVVDTARYTAHREGNVLYLPSSNQRHLVERFALADSGQSLVYSYEFSDPVYLTEPVSFEIRFRYAPELEFDPVPCNVENARRFLTD